MIRDEVLTEVRANRDELAKECGFDVHALFAAIRAKEARETITAASTCSVEAQAAEHAAAADEPTVAARRWARG